MRLGAEALASSELLAILLRSGTTRESAVDLGRHLMRHGDDSLRSLSRLSVADLVKLHGIGQVKAITLVAALELGRRRTSEADVARPLVADSRGAYEVLGPMMCDLPHEECWVLMLNTASRLIARERLSSGSVDGTVVDVRSVMACGLRHNASSMILAHNHPSGSLSASAADLAITRQIHAAGELMNLPLRDHIIVGGRRYYSFRDDNKLGSV